MRAIDVFHHVHTNPIVNAWYRISKEAEANELRLRELSDWLVQQGIASELVNKIDAKVRDLFDTNPGATKRQSFPLHMIEPTEILADTLDFDSKIGSMISNGYTSALKYLEAKELITRDEFQELLNMVIE